MNHLKYIIKSSIVKYNLQVSTKYMFDDNQEIQDDPYINIL